MPAPDEVPEGTKHATRFRPTPPGADHRGPTVHHYRTSRHPRRAQRVCDPPRTQCPHQMPRRIISTTLIKCSQDLRGRGMTSLTDRVYLMASGQALTPATEGPAEIRWNWFADLYDNPRWGLSTIPGFT